MLIKNNKNKFDTLYEKLLIFIEIKQQITIANE